MGARRVPNSALRANYPTLRLRVSENLWAQPYVLHSLAYITTGIVKTGQLAYIDMAGLQLRNHPEFGLHGLTRGPRHQSSHAGASSKTL